MDLAAENTEPVAVDRPETSPGLTMFSIFSYCWAVGTLGHLIYLEALFYVGVQNVLVVASIWCLLRPSSPVRFLVMATMQIVIWAMELPYVSNHWMLVACANGSILLAFATMPHRSSVRRTIRS